MPSQPISEEQFKGLTEITKTENNKFIVERDVLFYEMCFYLGLRPKECRCIEISHINFLDKKIFIPACNNKERHEDFVFVPEFLMNKIIFYLETRKMKTIELKSKWLFPCFWNRNKPVHQKTMQDTFRVRMRKLNYLYVNFIDGQNKNRYNYNLYSLRKHFGTFVYRKTRCPQKTALMLRQYDKHLKSVWAYVFVVEKEDRKELMEEIYSAPSHESI